MFDEGCHGEVFLELKRRGYKVFIGRFGNQEIDFIYCG